MLLLSKEIIGSEVPTDCAVVNIVKNTDSSCKIMTMKETAKVTDMDKTSVDTTEDKNITDNTYVANIDSIIQSIMESEDRPSTPPNDNDNNIVDKAIDDINNMKEVLDISKEDLGPEIPTDCAAIHTVKNTDSSCKTITMKEPAKVTYIVKISVDTTEDDNITDNKEAANITTIIQTLVKFKDWLSSPLNDNDNIIVDKVFDGSNNIK